MSFDGYNLDALDPLVIGKDVHAIFLSEDYLVLDTDQGRVAFSVAGDCCSRSYFHDITGADKLINNGPIISAKEIDLSDQEFEDEYEVIKVYGYEFVTEHPTWGEQTTVVSFRNSSNGYYGGWMQSVDDPYRIEVNSMHFVFTEHYEID